MHDRTSLGPADVDDERLAAFLAALWGAPEVTLLSSGTEPVAYDVPSIITASRTWVTGQADGGGGPRDFRVFVKVVQNWRRSPLFELVPPAVRAWAATTVPWEAEPLVYRSDLASALPEGLRMPQALAVIDLDELSRAIWLEAVDVIDDPWDRATYLEAGFLLGRLAGSSAVREFADLDPLPWVIDHYIQGRLVHDVFPQVMSDEPWQHPAVEATFGAALRHRLRAATHRIDDLATEFRTLPATTAHGDAAPGNLLRVAGEPGFVLIDYGFWKRQPIGHDLGQLLVGDLQLGKRGADDLAELDEAITSAYVAGLRAEGDQTPLEVVRRGHAVSMLIFSGLSALPVELLEAPDSPELRALLASRAAMAAYSLDLLESTETLQA
jgi:hypothetical protein